MTSPVRGAVPRAVLLLGGALAVAGCGAPVEPAYDKPAAAVEVLRLRWIARLGPELPNFMIPEMAEAHDRFNPIETSAAGFDTDLRRAFVGAAVGGLRCLDLRDGSIVWRFEVDDPVGSRPCYDPERLRVYFGADDGTLYALHARSGRELWRAATGAEIRSAIHRVEDTLYLANADSTVVAVDPVTGEVIWRYRRPPIEGFSSSGYADIRLHRGRVYAAMADGVVVALDAVSGALRWEHDLAAEVVTATREGDINLVDADATPVVVDGVLVASSISGGMAGLDAETGNVLWTLPTVDRVTGLATANDLVYAARAGVGITAVRPRAGEVAWTSTFGRGVKQDPLLHDDLLLVADSEDGLFAVSTADGRVLQRLDQNEGFFAPPSTAGGYLLALGNRGTLFAFALE